ncbi:MAG TPA: hypothetical protein VKE70_38130 [Candidatus Solibacter sp.]|nr:hypothetical protein [Candidatus Solibacter sp.]
MKKLAVLAITPLFAGFLFAQTTSQTTTTTTNWNGTLIDAGCRTTHVESKESNPTSTTTTSREITECPVTEATTTFGLVTTDGKYVRLDDASNTRVVEMVKGKHWHTYVTEKKPIKVHVVGTQNGDVIVVKTIQ